MKKVISTILSFFLAISLISCNQKSNSNTKTGEEYYYWSHVQMDDGILFKDAGGYTNILDYETMEATLLCNIPNCSHTTSQCLVSTLKTYNQLPIIYNNCAYYFSNYSEFADGDNGKRVLELRTTIWKYDFEKMEFSKILQIDGYNANIGSGSYLIGSEYYFTTNNGNPGYDEAGNVTRSADNGQGKLYSLNLDTEKLTDYGEVFDYEAYIKKYNNASIDTIIKGRNGNTLYLMVSICQAPYCYDETYTFDIKTHEFEKIADKRMLCVGEDYVVYMAVRGEYGKFDFFNELEFDFVVEDIKSGNVIKGCRFEAYNAVTTYNKKIWYDSKCFDIETQKEEIVSELDCGRVIGVYDNHYILTGYDENGQEIFEKIPCEEIDNLFAE